ncbi:MAG: DUF4416 family protein [Lentisphaeria bacterium]|nr:DUF4416 family protein [Lentisphaeria bacterium]
MLQLEKPRPVKVLAGVIYGAETAWEKGLHRMAAVWGEFDLISDTFPFDTTDYYAPEMGSGLTRRFVSFTRLVDPDTLGALKHQSNEIEADLSDGEARTINIDVGYLDVHKLVLATTKEGACRICLGEGMWADMTLLYAKGAFTAFPWTFADFRDKRYHPFLLRVRERYKRALHEAHGGV